MPPQCLSCEENIEYLESRRNYIEKAKVMLTVDEKNMIYDVNDGRIITSAHYTCPECTTTLFDTELEAFRFLKGRLENDIGE